MKQSCKFISIIKYVMKSLPYWNTHYVKILLGTVMWICFCVFDIFPFLDYVFNVQQTAYVCMSSRSILPCVQSGRMSKHTDGKIFLLSENLVILITYLSMFLGRGSLPNCSVLFVGVHHSLLLVCLNIHHS